MKAGMMLDFQDRPGDLPSSPLLQQCREASEVMCLWDESSESDRLEFPTPIQNLLAPGGHLRAQLEEFARGTINDKSGFPFPLRHWPELHEHMYKWISPLCKVTSIDREQKFSILKCYILSGAYHASLLRLSAEVSCN